MPSQPIRDDEYSKNAAASPAMNEDACIESLRNALKQWFSGHPNMNCYLAVDPSQRHLISNTADDSEPFASLPRADVIVDHEAFPEANRPYLLKLDLSSPTGMQALALSTRIAFEDRRPESMAEGLGQRIGGWLASCASLDEVAAHWSRLVLQRDNNGRAFALRFYDSRALALLWTALSQAQRQAMLGPVSAWHVLDAGARPKVHLASSDSRSNFMLSADQWREVHWHGVVNRALALYARTCAHQPHPAEIEAAVDAATRAEQYGLTDRDDQIAFIGHALAWHPHFDLHPKVMHLLQTRAADEFYTVEVGRLSADEIENIQKGSWYQPLTFATPHQD